LQGRQLSLRLAWSNKHVDVGFAQYVNDLLHQAIAYTHSPREIALGVSIATLLAALLALLPLAQKGIPLKHDDEASGGDLLVNKAVIKHIVHDVLHILGTKGSVLVYVFSKRQTVG